VSAVGGAAPGLAAPLSHPLILFMAKGMSSNLEQVSVPLPPTCARSWRAWPRPRTAVKRP
jgi:hypothetical protein